MINTRILVLACMILSVVVWRILPRPDELANFAPVMAVALFGGASFADRRVAFLIPLTAMFLSDLIIGLHDLLAWVYGSFAIAVMIGFWLRTRRQALPIMAATFACSCLFFLITNFGVWVTGASQSSPLYSLDAEGLVACYVAAIPFFRNSLLSDAVFAGALFGGLAIIEHWVPALREAMAPELEVPS